MTSNCINKRYGEMLHALELGMLSNEDLEKLQIHLMECEYCFSRAKEFLNAAALLRDDADVKSVIGELAEKETRPHRFLYRFKNLLWPDRPRFILAKPITVIVVLLFLSFPVYRVITSKMPRIEQTINFYPMRSGGENIIYKSKGGEVSINFVYEWAKPGREYMVLIAQPGGYSPYANGKYSNFNDQGLGSIVLHVNKFKRGSYILTIVDPLSGDSESKAVYYFRVE